MDSTELARVESEAVHDFAQVMKVDDLLAPPSSAGQRLLTVLQSSKPRLSSAEKDPSDMFWDRERLAVASVIAAQQAVGLLVGYDSFGLRIKIQRAAEAVGHVRQMNQRGREMPFLDRRQQVFFLAAPHALDEIGPSVPAPRCAGAGFLFFTQPGPV